MDVVGEGDRYFDENIGKDNFRQGSKCKKRMDKRGVLVSSVESKDKGYLETFVSFRKDGHKHFCSQAHLGAESTACSTFLDNA